VIKKLKHRYKERKFKRLLKQSVVLHKLLDLFMKRHQWPSWKRKQFWHDFIKSPASREKVLLEIYKSLNGGKRK